MRLGRYATLCSASCVEFCVRSRLVRSQNHCVCVCVCVFALWGGCSVIGAVCVRSVPDALDANSNARNNLQTWNAVSQSENSRVAIHRSKTSIYVVVVIAKIKVEHNPVDTARGRHAPSINFDKCFEAKADIADTIACALLTCLRFWLCCDRGCFSHATSPKSEGRAVNLKPQNESRLPGSFTLRSNK